MRSEEYLSQPDPCAILGISPDAGDEDVRTAYLRKIKEFPPDRNPAEFELVRDAYALMRDKRQRVRRRVLSIDPRASFETILHLGPPKRSLLGQIRG